MTDMLKRRRGRPRKDDAVNHFQAAGDARVTVRANGQETSMALRDADAEKLWADALNGVPKALAEIIRREREREAPLLKDAEQDRVTGFLGVHPALTQDEWEAVYGGEQLQPTIPLLEAFRAELGLEPSNSG